MKKILELYPQNPVFARTIRADPIRYRAFTVDTKVDGNPGHPVMVYVWPRNTTLDLAVGSQAVEFTAVESNRLFYIPYPQIQGHLAEVHAQMDGGGM